MTKRHVMLTLPGELHSEPIIYNMGQQFNLAINIRQADVTEDRGWIVLEIEGKEQDIEAGVAWATSKGVRAEIQRED